MLSVLMEHAIDLGWREENPAKSVKQVKTPDGQKKEHLPWPDWAVDRWRAEAEPEARLIFELLVGNVQRPDDLVEGEDGRLGFLWGDYDGERLNLAQNKTGRELLLPCTPHLKAALDGWKASLRAAPLPSAPILTDRRGGAMKYYTMARVMMAERKRLKTTAFDLHALRYRGVMDLAWAGCDDDETYSGHSSKSMVVKYAG